MISLTLLDYFQLNQNPKCSIYFLSLNLIVELQFQKQIKHLQSNSGGKFYLYLSSHGILYCVTCPNMHTQNGIIKQKYGHIVDTGLALITHVSVPLTFWPYVFAHAVYLINILLSTSLNNLSPQFLLHKSHPNYIDLKAFDCECWPFITPYNQNKFNFCFIPCVSLDPSPNH